jgi:AAA15 family ATPase/GTPase
LEWKPNKRINVLVGGNGIGKSNIAIAIDYLLNPYIQWYNRKMSEFDYYNRELDKPVEIEVWFKDVEEFIEDDWELYLEHVNKEDEITTDGNCELTLRLKLYATEDQIPHHVILTNDKEYPLRTSQKGFINYIYISANREPLKELSLSNGSLLNSILEKDIMDEKVKELMDSFNMKSRELFSDTNEGVFSTLSKSVKEFGLANEESAITIEPTELSDRKTLQTFSLVCKNNELTNYIPLKYQSDGIKNIIYKRAKLQTNISIQN